MFNNNKTVISPTIALEGEPPQQQSLHLSSPSRRVAQQEPMGTTCLSRQGDREAQKDFGFFLAQLASRADESNRLCCKDLLFLGEPIASSPLKYKYFTWKMVQIIHPTSFTGIPAIFKLFADLGSLKQVLGAACSQVLVQSLAQGSPSYSSDFRHFMVKEIIQRWVF